MVNLENNPEKTALRKILLEKRDTTSFDMMKIASKQIHKNLKKIDVFNSAKKIGAYYPIGSEVLTQDIMQEAFSQGKQVYLPKVIEKEMEFREINGFDSLEKGSFDILEPKDGCPVESFLDVILVPTVGISLDGVRLGYGHGYYDRFLSKNKHTTISLILEKQVIKNIPRMENDVIIDWVVTESGFFKTS